MNDAPYEGMFAIMDSLAPSLGEEVVMQVGNSGFTGRNTKCFPFKPDAEMQALFDEASLIVCHAGIGSILNGMERNVPLVLVPRDVVVPEAVNDQQAIVAAKVEALGRAVVVSNLDELGDAIERARHLEFPPYVRDDSLCVFLSGLLDEIASKKGKRD